MKTIDEYNKNFAVFILTHGRPNKVYTYKTLLNSGYTGKIYFIIDDQDKTKDEYLNLYKDNVIIFNKEEISKTFDQGDNFNDKRAIIYARNVSFEIARKLGIKYFIQLDDDYTNFNYRFDYNFNYNFNRIKSLDKVFLSLLDFFIKTNVFSICISQGGDFIGGSESDMASCIKLKRKAMNSFICSTERPFRFIGRINEDVNTYTYSASKGMLFFTTNQVALQQLQTQKNSGGMTELYLDSGTYIKSFYTVMYHPSSVVISRMNSKYGRLHHSINWNNTVPKIINEDTKKY